MLQEILSEEKEKKLGLPDYNPGGGKGGSELNVINRLIQSGAIDKNLQKYKKISRPKTKIRQRFCN